jgi:HAD superfamily hydrolase (TIGR01509 family)
MHTPSLPWQAVFFDFDGVIADSTDVKVRAFATLFAPYGPAVQQAVVRYHLDNGGMPRHLKLRHCVHTFVGRTIDEAELEQLGMAFSRQVFDAVVAAPLIDGTLATLQQLQQAGIPAFVVSGTPELEMRRIVTHKGLAPYFSEVHGSPRVKADIVRDILARHGFSPSQCLFIGDALADHRAACATGLHFLGIVPAGRDSIFPPTVVTRAQVTLDG